MGTPSFAVPPLVALLESRHQVVAVLTQPDRPAGRGHKLTPSPVKTIAAKHGLPIFQPQTLRYSESKEIRSQLKNYDADIFVVAAYGLLLPKGVLDMPGLGCINVHASLLPQYRGASPIHAALLNGDDKSGITIMHMAAGIDTGDMILKKELEILPEERFPSLHDRMAELGAEALMEALELLEGGSAPRTPQDDALSSYAPMLKKTDAIIDWGRTSAQIINMTRAFDPWPGSQTMYDGKALKIWRLEEEKSSVGTIFVPTEFCDNTQPGTVLAVDPARGVLIKTGDGAVWATELQGDGSKRMAAEDYLRGRKIHKGAILHG